MKCKLSLVKPIPQGFFFVKKKKNNNNSFCIHQCTREFLRYGAGPKKLLADSYARQTF